LHTLGPSGTNCEAAAYEWFSRQGRTGKVYLHPTLETAAQKMNSDGSEALLACVVYPELHTLVFSNLKFLDMIDCFVFPTRNMVLAARNVETIKSVSTHPAPQKLVPSWIQERRLVNSNAQAAVDCAAGITDACITTIAAAKAYKLQIIEDFGPVPMGFTIHAPANYKLANPKEDAPLALASIN
jgi:prephenate dehydratase